MISEGTFCDYPGCKEKAIKPTETLCDWYSEGVSGMGWEYRCGGQYIVCSKHKFLTSQELLRAKKARRRAGAIMKAGLK